MTGEEAWEVVKRKFRKRKCVPVMINEYELEAEITVCMALMLWDKEKKREYKQKYAEAWREREAE